MRAALGATALSAVCLAAAGCGGGGSSDALSGLTAQQIITKSANDLKAQSSFHISGTAAEDSENIGLDFSYLRGQGCEGTLSLGSKGSLALIVIGNTVYIKPDTQFWKSFGGSQANSVLPIVGGKYLKTTKGDSTAADFTQFCNADSLASSFTKPTDVVKGAMTTINGQQALELKDQSKGGVLYVTNTSSPQVLRVTGDQSGNSGQIDFTDYGQSVTLTAPPASDVLNGSQYGF
jgi:hypothetical protein